jgi:hypothetical protein
MRVARKLWILAVAIVGMTSTVYAGDSIVGVWHGSFKYDLAKLPKGLSSNQVKGLEDEARSRRNDSITLTLRGDHKFLMSVKGPKKPPPPVIGKWMLNGNSLQLQAVRDGRPDAPRTLTVSKDGKAITLEYGPSTMKFWR